MGYKDITAGEKVAQAKGARFIESKRGTMGIEVAFEFIEPSTDSVERLNWTGWLTTGDAEKQGAMEKTMETLVDVLGFNGDDSCNADGTLANPNALDYARQVRLVVDLETYNNKTYPKIKWVNSLGGSGFQKCEPTVIKQNLGSLGFKAAFLAASQKNKPAGAATVSVPEEKLPF